jgi:Outer membrane lipoprotein
VVRRFLHDFPESEHVEDAQRVERDVLALLARHELYVAGFYLGRDRPQAAVMRIETLLANYSGSGVEPEAMLLLGRVYLHMRDRTQAQRAFEGIITDFPESGFATQARDYLRELGMPSVDAPPPAAEPEPEPVEPVEEPVEDEVEEELVEETLDTVREEPTSGDETEATEATEETEEQPEEQPR